MSPQITAAKAQGKAVYDGTKSDVWAMGVLLCVMLIGGRADGQRARARMMDLALESWVRAGSVCDGTEPDVWAVGVLHVLCDMLADGSARG